MRGEVANCRVEHVTPIPALSGESGVAKVRRRVDVIEDLRPASVVALQHILDLVSIMLKQAILPPIHLITVLAMLRLKDIVSRADLRLLLNGIQVWMPRFQLLQALLDGGYIRGVLQVEFPEPPLVLRLFELLIEHAVRPLAQADAPEALTATEAVLAELTLPAITTILTEITHVASGAVGALPAPLAPHAEGEIGTGDALARVASVVDILTVEDPEAVVAALRLHGGVGVVAVLRHRLLQVVARLGEEEPTEFFDEGHADPAYLEKVVAKLRVSWVPSFATSTQGEESP